MVENCDGFIEKIGFCWASTFCNLFSLSLHFIVFRALVERKVKLCVISSYNFRNKKFSKKYYLLADLIIGFDKVRDRSVLFLLSHELLFVMRKRIKSKKSVENICE